MPIKILEGAEPLFLPGGPVGCLCLHGLSGTPQEMSWLAMHLAAQGATVAVPRLAGHAIHPDFLARTRWQDWYASALDSYHLLRPHCDRVFVLGLSMGGLVSLLLAAHEPLAGAVIMAAPLTFADPKLKLAHALRYVTRYVPTQSGGGGPDPLDEAVKAGQAARGQKVTGRVSYRGQYTMAGISEIQRLQERVKADMNRITMPLLLIYAERDQTARVSDMETIRQTVASRDVRTVRLPESDHVVTNDLEHLRVFDEAWSFIRSLTQDRIDSGSTR